MESIPPPEPPSHYVWVDEKRLERIEDALNRAAPSLAVAQLATDISAQIETLHGEVRRWVGQFIIGSSHVSDLERQCSSAIREVQQARIASAYKFDTDINPRLKALEADVAETKAGVAKLIAYFKDNQAL